MNDVKQLPRPTKEEIIDALGKAAELIFYDAATGNSKAGVSLSFVKKAIAQYSPQHVLEINKVLNQSGISGIMGNKRSRFNTKPPKGTASATLKKVPAEPASKEKAAIGEADRLKAAENAGHVKTTESINELLRKISEMPTKKILSEYKKDGIIDILNLLQVTYDEKYKPMQLAAHLRQKATELLDE